VKREDEVCVSVRCYECYLVVLVRVCGWIKDGLISLLSFFLPQFWKDHIILLFSLFFMLTQLLMHINQDFVCFITKLLAHG